MAVRIRMARAGAHKRPYYKIVIADARSPRDGKFIEKVGTHNPFLDHENPNRVVLNIERIKYWLSVGATSSDRITRFLLKAGLLDKSSSKSTAQESTSGESKQTKQHLPRKKAQERMRAEAANREAVEQALKDAEQAKTAAEEAAREAEKQAGIDAKNAAAEAKQLEEAAKQAAKEAAKQAEIDAKNAPAETEALTEVQPIVEEISLETETSIAPESVTEEVSPIEESALELSVKNEIGETN